MAFFKRFITTGRFIVRVSSKKPFPSVFQRMLNEEHVYLDVAHTRCMLL